MLQVTQAWRNDVTLRYFKHFTGHYYLRLSQVSETRFRQKKHSSNMFPYQWFVATVHIHSYDYHLGQGGVQGELYHLTSQGSEASCIVQRAQNPQLIHGIQNVVLQVNVAINLFLRVRADIVRSGFLKLSCVRHSIHIDVSLYRSRCSVMNVFARITIN